MQLEGRKALVTGGARGIGLALSKALILKGVTVLACGRDQNTLNSAASKFPGRFIPLQVDLFDDSSRIALITRICEDHRDLSIVINNAGIQDHVNYFAPAPYAWERAGREIAINLDAVVHLSIGLLPLLQAQPSAALVSISSGLALAPKSTAAVYCATKSAVRSFTRALRYQAEDAGSSVRILDVIMALVETDMTKGRGRSKITAEQAAAEIVTGMEKESSEIWVERTRLLRLVHRLSPNLAYRIMRDG